MAAFLREALVLDVDAGDAAPLVLAHRAHDVELVAVAGVGVGDHRHATAAAMRPALSTISLMVMQAVIGIAERRRGAAPVM